MHQGTAHSSLRAQVSFAVLNRKLGAEQVYLYPEPEGRNPYPEVIFVKSI